MFRIRRLGDLIEPGSRDALAAVQVILREQFSAARPEDIDAIASKIENPLTQRFCVYVFVAERTQSAIVGAARPEALVVALGLDTAKADPTGSWVLEPDDFFENGKLVGSLRLPTVVVQEGGYGLRAVGKNAARFFEGLVEGAAK